jgi:hypothetical protein
VENNGENADGRHSNSSALEIPSVFVKLEEIEAEAQRRAHAILKKDRNRESSGSGDKSSPSRLGTEEGQARASAYRENDIPIDMGGISHG